MTSDTRLRYLYESARLETMRAASEKLDVATSSVSRQIAELEKELGIALIEKGRRRIKLTEAGETACIYYKERLSQEEAFLSRIEELKSLRTGKILLAVGQAFVTRQLSDMLQAYMQKYTSMKVQVEIAKTSDVIELVREDDAHMGLIFDVPKDPKIRNRLTLSQPIKVIVHKNHRLSRKKCVSLEELTGENIGLPAENYRIRQVIHAAEQEEGVNFESSMVTNSLTLITDFVKSGSGISFMPELVVQQELRNGELVALTTNNQTLNSTGFSLITRLGRQLPIGAHRLMLNIEAYLKSATSTVN